MGINKFRELKSNWFRPLLKSASKQDWFSLILNKFATVSIIEMIWWNIYEDIMKHTHVSSLISRRSRQILILNENLWSARYITRWNYLFGEYISVENIRLIQHIRWINCWTTELRFENSIRTKNKELQIIYVDLLISFHLS